MSLQSGRKGIGNHKHGISGYAPTTGRYKMWLARTDNKEKERKQHEQKWYDSIPSLFAHRP